MVNFGAHKLVQTSISVLPGKFEFLGRTGHLLLRPSKLAETRVFLALSVRLDNAVSRWLYSFILRWIFHIRCMNVMDADMIVLHDLQANRYTSHTFHCKTCMALQKFLGRADIFVQVVGKLSFIALLCLTLMWVTESPALMQ